MRILFLIWLIFTNCGRLSGQHDGSLRNIVPPSPQASVMTRYGNMPLNEYQGMAEISIPIAEIKEKTIGTKINLTYTKPGVKVADISNSTGINWLLQVGGVITRTVYDEPDEGLTTRLIFDNFSDLQNIANSPDGSSNAFLLNSYHNSALYDNEIDIFEFSVNGISGKFYLDKNLNPVLLSKNSSVKIETIGDFRYTHQFVLISNDGTQYYFGGENAMEKTFIRNINYASNNVTSFYLTRIKGKNGDEINFIYDKVGPRAYWREKIEQMQLEYEEQGCVIGNHSSNHHMPYSNESSMLRVLNAVLLTSVVGGDKTIKLNYGSVSNSTGKKITSIEVLNNKSEKIIQEYNFEYLDQSFTPNQIERFFLTKLKKYNFDGQNIKIPAEEYSFTYDNPLMLPERISFSVDAFGYFNGKNNSTFLPDLKQLHNIDVKSSMYPNFKFADRRSDFEYAKTGSLTSITYPTKGTTFFEYEGVSNIVEVTEEGSKYLHVYNNPSALSDSMIISGNEFNGIVKGKIYISEYEIHPSNMFSYPISVKLKIVDTSTNQSVFTKSIGFLRPADSDYEQGYRQYSEDFYFPIDINTKYKLMLDLVEKGNINYIGEVIIPVNIPKIITNSVGIRLKKMFDEDINGGQQNIKRLYYSSYKDIKKTPRSLSIPYPIAYTRYIFNSEPCFSNNPNNSGIPTSLYTLKQLILSSSPNSSLDWENFTEKFLYSTVTTSYGGDNFEMGGEEKTFITGQKESTYILKMPNETTAGSFLDTDIITDYHRNFMFDEFNGRPRMIKQFTNKNNNIFLLSKTEFDYDYNPVNVAYDLIVKPAYKLLDAPIGLDINAISSNLFIACSPLFSYYTSAINQTEYEYCDDTPADIEDDSSFKKLITKRRFLYSNPTHCQLTDQKVIFPDLSVQNIHYEYAHEKSNQYLIDRNMVGVPLQTTVTKTDNGVTKTISDMELLYPASQSDADHRTGGLAVPYAFVSHDLKSGDAVTEATYDRYDERGNLQQYTVKSGLPTAVVWGYGGTQPIAKVEGARYTDIDVALINSIVQASDADNADPDQEPALITALDRFRRDPRLSGYQITTYTYDPLVGVTSITPPSGIREYYHYDAANRLDRVTDVNGSILKEYQYNYKH